MHEYRGWKIMKVNILDYTINLKFIILPIVYIVVGMVVFAIIKKLVLQATTRNTSSNTRRIS